MADRPEDREVEVVVLPDPVVLPLPLLRQLARRLRRDRPTGPVHRRERPQRPG